MGLEVRDNGSCFALGSKRVNLSVHSNWVAFQREEPSELLKNEGLRWPQFQRSLLVKEIWISDWLKHFRKISKKNPWLLYRHLAWWTETAILVSTFCEGSFISFSSNQPKSPQDWEAELILHIWAQPWSDVTLDVLRKSPCYRGTDKDLPEAGDKPCLCFVKRVRLGSDLWILILLLAMQQFTSNQPRFG